MNQRFELVDEYLENESASPGKSEAICIEEPELGIHTDIIPILACLLKEASERTQLIATHYEALIDELSDDPESVIICHYL